MLRVRLRVRARAAVRVAVKVRVRLRVRARHSPWPSWAREARRAGAPRRPG